MAWGVTFGVCVGSSLGLVFSGRLEGALIAALGACLVVTIFMLERGPEGERC